MNPHLMSWVASEHVCSQYVSAVIATPGVILCTFCVFAACAHRCFKGQSPNKLAAGAERLAERSLGLNWAQSTTVYHTSVSCYVFLAKGKRYPFRHCSFGQMRYARATN